MILTELHKRIRLGPAARLRGMGMAYRRHVGQPPRLSATGRRIIADLTGREPGIPGG